MKEKPVQQVQPPKKGFRALTNGFQQRNINLLIALTSDEAVMDWTWMHDCSQVMAFQLLEDRQFNVLDRQQFQQLNEKLKEALAEYDWSTEDAESLKDVANAKKLFIRYNSEILTQEIANFKGEENTTEFISHLLEQYQALRPYTTQPSREFTVFETSLINFVGGHIKAVLQESCSVVEIDSFDKSGAIKEASVYFNGFVDALRSAGIPENKLNELNGLSINLKGGKPIKLEALLIAPKGNESEVVSGTVEKKEAEKEKVEALSKEEVIAKVQATEQVSVIELEAEALTQEFSKGNPESFAKIQVLVKKLPAKKLELSKVKGFDQSKIEALERRLQEFIDTERMAIQKLNKQISGLLIGVGKFIEDANMKLSNFRGVIVEAGKEKGGSTTFEKVIKALEPIKESAKICQGNIVGLSEALAFFQTQAKLYQDDELQSNVGILSFLAEDDLPNTLSQLTSRIDQFDTSKQVVKLPLNHLVDEEWLMLYLQGKKDSFFVSDKTMLMAQMVHCNIDPKNMLARRDVSFRLSDSAIPVMSEEEGQNRLSFGKVRITGVYEGSNSGKDGDFGKVKDLKFTRVNEIGTEVTFSSVTAFVEKSPNTSVEYRF